MSTGPGMSGGFRSAPSPPPRVARRRAPVPGLRRLDQALRVPTTSSVDDGAAGPGRSAPRRPARPRSPSAGCPVAAASRWPPSATRSTTRSTPRLDEDRRAGSGPRSRHRPGRRRPRRHARRAAGGRHGPPQGGEAQRIGRRRPRRARADGETRKPRRVVKGLVAMTVVALGVLGVYSSSRPRPQEAASQSTATAEHRAGARPRHHRPAAGAAQRRRSTSPPRPTTPVRVPVTVLNATDINGLAAKVAAAFGAGGWETPGVGAYDADDVAASTVFFTEGDEKQRQAAVQLVDAVPAAAGPGGALLRGPGRRHRARPGRRPDRRLAALIRRTARPTAAAQRNTAAPPSVGRCVRPLRGLVRPRPRPGARATLAALLAVPLLAGVVLARRRASAADDVRTEDARVPSGSGADAVELDTTLYLPGRRRAAPPPSSSRTASAAARTRSPTTPATWPSAATSSSPTRPAASAAAPGRSGSTTRATRSPTSPR